MVKNHNAVKLYIKIAFVCSLLMSFSNDREYYTTYFMDILAAVDKRVADKICPQNIDNEGTS